MASKEQSVILKKEDLADVPSGFWDKGLFQEPVEVADIVSTSAPTRRHRVVRKDHGVFAQHNKFGTFEVPKTFLNNDEEAAKCAAEVAEKQAAKKAVKQSKTAQKTKKEASAEQAKAVPSKAVRATPSKVESSAVSFRTLALLGVAAVFGAILTQPSALGSKTQGPSVGVAGVACSPQWLPMIMAVIEEPPMPPPSPSPPPPDVLQMTLIAVGEPSSFTVSNKADLTKRLALCSEQINTEQITVIVGPSESEISSVLKFRIVANGPFTPLVIKPPSSLVVLLQECLGIDDRVKASTVLGLGTTIEPGVLTKPQYEIGVPQSPLPAPSPAPSPPPSPSPPPPVPDVAPVQKKITLVKGWQVSSFQYLCEGDFTVITKSSVGWKVNDKMMARMGSLKIATYDGTKWQGELVRTGLFFKYGYKIFSKVAGVVITQTCENQNPVKDIPLTKGWNWMGSPYIGCFPINELKTVGDGQFTVDDEIKSRALQVRISRYDGEEWTTSSIPCFQNGMGYEVKVNVSVTVSFNK